MIRNLASRLMAAPLLSCLLVGTLAGCGGGGPEVPDTAPAGGTVTLDGAPVEGATVTFIPDARDDGAIKNAYGTTDANGKFTLSTPVSGTKTDGAVLGRHQVTITKIKAVETQSSGSGEYGTDSYVPPEANPTPPAANAGPEYIVPQAYGSTGNGLEANVTADGENQFTFDLTSAGPGA